MMNITPGSPDDNSSDAQPTDEDRRLVEAAMIVSEPSVTAVWDNAEDDVYNDL